MSEYDVIMEYDDEFEELFRDRTSAVEDDPVPAPPADELGSLVCGEDQLFTDSQLVQVVNMSPRDPATPAPRSAEAEQALQPSPIGDWAQHVAEQEEILLGSSEDKEEEQQEGDRQELLPSIGEASDQEVSQEVVEQVPHQSESQGPDLVWEAQHRASLQQSLDCISATGF